MAKRMTGPEHIEAAQDCLTDIAQARRERDWPQVTALADAAQAHLAMAELARLLPLAPSATLAGRNGQRWLDAAGVEGMGR